MYFYQALATAMGSFAAAHQTKADEGGKGGDDVGEDKDRRDFQTDKGGHDKLL